MPARMARSVNSTTGSSRRIDGSMGPLLVKKNAERLAQGYSSKGGHPSNVLRRRSAFCTPGSCSDASVSTSHQLSGIRGRFSRNARMSSGVVGMSRSRSRRSKESGDFIEALLQSMAVEVALHLAAVDSGQVEEETDVLLLAKHPVRIVLHGRDFESNQMLGPGNRNFQAAGALGPSGSSEELLGRLPLHVDEVQRSPGSFPVGVVREPARSVKGLVTNQFQPAEEVFLHRRFDDKVEIQGRPRQSIHGDGHAPDHGIPGTSLVEETSDSTEDVREVHARIEARPAGRIVPLAPAAPAFSNDRLPSELRALSPPDADP